MRAAERSVAASPRTGDTLVLPSGAALMVLDTTRDTLGEIHVDVRVRPWRGKVEETSVPRSSWEICAGYWLRAGAEVVPAESPEQIYPIREMERRVRAKIGELKEEMYRTFGLSRWTEVIP